MRTVIVILAITTTALAAALVSAKRNAGVTGRALLADLGVASNRLAELEIKLNHQERLASAMASQLTNCTEALNRRVSELEAERSILNHVRAEKEATQEQLMAATAQLRQVETEVKQLQERCHELESLCEQAENKSRWLARQLELSESRHKQTVVALVEARTELEQLRACFRDPELLRKRLAALMPPRRVSSPKPLAVAPEPKSAPPLQLLPDGSVQVAE